MRRVEWWWFRPSSTTGCRDNRQNVYKIANSLTFCRLSRQRMMVEGHDYRHSNHLDATNRMVVVRPSITTGCRDNRQNVNKAAIL